MTGEVSGEQVQGWLERARAGDREALNALLVFTTGRLRRLTRVMLRGHPAVRRWEEPEDVLQNALVRLLRALESVPPATAREFFALAARHIRWELVDLARRYYGPQGWGANHASASDNSGATGPDVAD